MVRTNPSTTTMSFMVQAITGRWFSVFATVLIMVVSGPRYLFALYSGVIKSSLGYTQTTLNTISFFKDVGSTFGVPSGLLMEVAPPWVVLVAGGVLNIFGYFMIWLAVTHRIEKPAVWQMCLYIALGANFTTFSNTATVVPCVINFPEARGVTLGILKGFTGLSSAIITQLYSAILGQNPKAFLLFLAFLPAAVSFPFIRTIRIIKNTDVVVSNTEQNDVRPFNQLLYISLALAAFLFSMIILQTRRHFSRGAYVGSSLIIVFLLCLVLYIVFTQELRIRKLRQLVHQTSIDNISQSSNINVVTELVDLPASKADIWYQNVFQHHEREYSHVNAITGVGYPPDRKVDRWYQNMFRPPKSGEDHTILQALFRIDMIILLIGAICGLGGTWTAIDNMGQIGASLGYSDKNISTFVSLSSIWNYLGRVISGYTSEYITSKYKLPRPLTITILQLLSCGGYLIIAFGVPNGLYLASVIIGFCYGAFWPILLAIISEIFGLKHYSMLFNIVPMASPLGIYLFNVKVTGDLYDREAKRKLEALGMTWKVGEELKCEGVSCFRAAFLIIATVTAMAALLSLVNVKRSRGFYRGDIYERFRKVEKAMENGDDGVIVVVEGNPEDMTSLR